MNANKSILHNNGILGVLIAVVIFVFIFSTSEYIGLVRDEGHYLQDAENITDWLEVASHEFNGGNWRYPFSRECIDEYFRHYWLHPPFVRNLFAIANHIMCRTLDVMTPIASARLVSALFSALIGLMVFAFGKHYFDLRTALLSPFLLFLMPHIFFHSHVACLDIPVMFFWTGIILLFTRYLTAPSRTLAVIIAVFWGWGITSKHNLFFAPFVLFFMWILSFCVNYRRLKTQPDGILSFLRMIPLPFYLFIFISIPVFVVSWPWLWHDTADRFIAYAKYHLAHENYDTYYFGTNLREPPFPVSYPWVMTVITTPLPVLLAMVAGVYYLAMKVIKRYWDFIELQVYGNLLLGALFPIMLISLPSVPIYGGIKHWIGGYPIMLAAGVFVIFKCLDVLIDRIYGRKKALIQTALGLLLLAALIPANLKFLRHGPAYYNSLIGGMQGAAEKGMQRNFWGYDSTELIPILNAQAPKNSKVYIMSSYEGIKENAFYVMRDSGVIRNDLIPTNELTEADFAFFFYEKQNVHVLYEIFKEFGTCRPMALTEVDSVFLSALYKRNQFVVNNN